MSGSPERVVIVTGAASGIGAATARLIAAPGTALLLTTRANTEGLARTAEAAHAAGALVAQTTGDLAEEGTAEALVARARSTFGRVDQIVSNAGRAEKAGALAVSPADVLRGLGVNTLPFLALARAAEDDLVASQWGRIVAVSSFVADAYGVNGTLFPATAAAKAALESLSRSLAYELAPKGVTVNCVAPGFTRKVGGHAALSDEGWQAAARATPSGRIAEPEDVAAVIVFLLSRPAAHVTGQVIRVDGGLSLL